MEVITKPRNTIYRKLQVKNYVLLYRINEKNKRVDILFKERLFTLKIKPFLDKIGSIYLQI